jgi:ABC-type branched-subunit amino acid transport system ATPase component/branched-subunit amino acid ABC-type transport system permease component
MGLVLTYKTSGVFNFAHGAIAAGGALVFYYLRTDHHVPWALAALISVGIFGPVVGLVFELIARRLSGVTAAWQILATVGVVIVVEAVANLAYGQQVKTFEPFLPSGSYQLGSVSIGYDQTITFAVGVVAVTALYLLLRYTQIGFAMRAVVDSPELLDLRGVNPTKVRRSAWMLGCTLASMSGILLAPSVNLDAKALVLLVVQSFGAAAIGYFSNLPLAYAGGLLLGVGGSLLTEYVSSTSWLAGLPSSLPFVVLLIALVVTPKARLARTSVVALRAIKPSWQAPGRVRLSFGVGLAVLLLFVPEIVGTKLDAYTGFLIYTILFLSLGLLVKLSGQVSLGHLGFAAVGAVSFAHLAAHGVPWGLALLLGGLITVPVGAAVAIPAIRLSGVFLALATLGFAVLLEQLIYPTSLMFGQTTNGVSAPQPGISLFTSSRGFYFLVLGCVLLVVILLTLVQQGRMGRLLRALSDSRTALETHGLTSSLTLVSVFCISAFVAGIAGGLLASFYRFATASTFGSAGSLILFAVLLIVAAGAPWYAFMAAAAFILVPTYITVSGITDYLNLAFGISAVAVALTIDLAPGTPQFVRRLFGRRTAADSGPADLGGESRSPLVADLDTGPSDTAGDTAGGTAAETAAVLSVPAGGKSVAVRDVVVRFGGLVALDGVGLSAPAGRITGLIGPNGAGKTTLLNVVSGLQKSDRGQVLIGEDDVSRHGPSWRARQGVGRTFQRVQLWDTMTVEENVRMGREAFLAGGRVRTQLIARPGESRVIADAAQSAMKLAGILDLRDRPVRNLSAGQRRLVELARSLACPFDVFLLDEPSSGLDPGETRIFGQTLQRVVAERGSAILLVEHDMSLVMGVCEYVYVIDFGKPLFEGTPSQVSAAEVVRAAYLGVETSDELFAELVSGDV